jgi:hypothetical protein
MSRFDNPATMKHIIACRCTMAVLIVLIQTLEKSMQETGEQVRAAKTPAARLDWDQRLLR